MKKLIFCVITILCCCSACNKEDVQSSYLKINDEYVASFFVVREINTNHFIVVKGIHVEGDNIPIEDSFLRIEISDDQFNKTFNLTTDNQWRASIGWGGVIRVFNGEQEDIDEKSICQVKYHSGSRFDIRFLLYTDSDWFHAIELFYTGNVILVDSDWNVVK